MQHAYLITCTRPAFLRMIILLMDSDIRVMKKINCGESRKLVT